MEFRFGDLISDIYKGKALNKDELTATDNKNLGVRYITRTGENNGCELIALRQDIPDGYIEKGNALSIGDTTATCFYQDEDFVVGDHMVVVRADWLRPLVALYVVAILNNEQYKYSYGRAFLMDRIKDTIIKLPVDNDGNPDWQFMEDYMKSLHHKPISTNNLEKKAKDLNIKDWKEFCLKDYFDLKRGHTLTVEMQEEYSGTFPCVNGTLENNGVQYYLSEELEVIGFNKIKAPAISIVRVGEGGKTFVQNQDFFIADNAFALIPLRTISTFALLFISTVLNKESIKYSYGRTVTNAYKESIIKLPAILNPQTNKYEPDWQFMEDYMKSLPYGDRI